MKKTMETQRKELATKRNDEIQYGEMSGGRHQFDGSI